MMDSGTQHVLTALAKKTIGCHYLTGAAGASPGQENGAAYRPGHVALAKPGFSPNKPCIFAAESTINGDHSVCGGRWKPFGREAKPSDWDLTNYLKEQEAKYKSTGKMDPYYKVYTPRRVKFKGKESEIAWGEDCRSKRHFDCVGLVNYLLSSVCDMKKSFKGKGFSADVLMHKNASTPVALSAAPVGGDILYKNINGVDHIALLLADGNVIQAEQTSVGVTLSPFKGTSWHYRGRYHGSLFLCMTPRPPREQRERPIVWA